jgi:hypothetical protein
MKVQELIESLGRMNPEAEVHFSYNYGDYWRTEVAPKISQVDEGLVAYSEYHRMDRIVEEEDSYMDEEPGNPDENVRRVVVIG